MEPVATQPTLLELLADCDQCLGEMHQKGMNESIMRIGIEAAFRKDDSEGLKSLLASMRHRIRTHDAQQAAIVPAPSAPAPPSSRPPIPNPSDSRTKSGQGRQAIAPTQSKAAKAAKPSADTTPAPKRRRLLTCDTSSCEDKFLQHFRVFAFGFGRDILSQGDSLTTVTDQFVQQAFLNSLPPDWGQNGERCPKSPSSTSSVGNRGRKL